MLMLLQIISSHENETNTLFSGVSTSSHIVFGLITDIEWHHNKRLGSKDICLALFKKYIYFLKFIFA